MVEVWIGVVLCVDGLWVFCELVVCGGWFVDDGYDCVDCEVVVDCWLVECLYEWFW